MNFRDKPSPPPYYIRNIYSLKLLRENRNFVPTLATRGMISVTERDTLVSTAVTRRDKRDKRDKEIVNPRLA